MTLRGILLGLLLALLVSVATYFNDWIIGQTLFIGNHLPISVFGGTVFLVLVVNPVLSRLRASVALRGGEIVLIAALGSAACGFPGSSFFRYFVTATALPAHWYKTTPSWQATEVMSYVPGGSAELGVGHIQNWPELTRRIVDGSNSSEPSPARQIWSELSPDGRIAFLEASRDGVEPGDAPNLTRILNQSLARPSFYDPQAFRAVALPKALESDLARAPSTSLGSDDLVRRNRLLLASWLPGVVLPPPPGSGALLAGGRADPIAVDALLQGRSKSNPLALLDLPWRTWWPTIELWGSLALLLGCAALCMALIVHQQWSKRELLPYPVVRFIDEATHREAGRRLPEIARNKLFWAAFLVVAWFHLVNGIHAWFPEIPEIPRKFDFWALVQLFPNVARIYGSWDWFGPTFYPSVVAFAFFMSTSVSFSLGIAFPLFFMLGSFLISQGTQFDSGGIGAKRDELMRAGAYLSTALMIGYTGRRYYANVARAALGLGHDSDVPSFAVWAARALTLIVAIAAALLISVGLGLGFSLALIGLILVIVLVTSRLVTETGAFFTQAGWAPAALITTVLGFDAMGPTTFIMLALGSVILINDTRETLMPFLTNGLKMMDRADGAPPQRVAPWLLVAIIGSFAIAGATTIYLQYNHGVTQVGNTWGTDRLPLLAFDSLAQYLSEAQAYGVLADATKVSGVERLFAIHPEPNIGWLVGGMAIALLAAAARLRFPWWPLHPVAFLVWGTYPVGRFGPSFLVGWIVKALVVGSAGAKGYHDVKPVMIGVIAAELLSGLLWMIVGAVYFAVVGKTPVTYSIFPF